MEKSPIVGDLRSLLQDVVTPDLKTLAVFDRIMSALDMYKEVQDLKEFRIRMEERQKASA